MRYLSILIFALLAGCASLTPTSKSQDVIQYSMSRHGMFLDELIPFAKQTGIFERDGYKAYFDKITDNDWNDEYSRICRFKSGHVQTKGKYYSVRHCLNDNKNIMFSWFYGYEIEWKDIHTIKIETALNPYRQTRMHKSMNSKFIVIMPTKITYDINHMEMLVAENYSKI